MGAGPVWGISRVLSIQPDYFTGTDTYAATGSGQTIDAHLSPVREFGIQVAAVGGTPTLWTIILEGSLDGTNFSTILTHTQALGLGVILWSTVPAPVSYFRTRCSVLTLGAASSATAYVLGVA